MTKAGRLSIEFEEFKSDVEARLTALESGSAKETKEPKKPQKKDKNIVVDTKGNDIVATEE